MKKKANLYRLRKLALLYILLKVFMFSRGMKDENRTLYEKD